MNIKHCLPSPASMLRSLLLTLIVVSVVQRSPLYAYQADSIDFSRDIQPILSENCYFCHGPDGEQRQGDLRLDVEEDARHVLEAGAADSSELVRRLLAVDADEKMPPPDSNRQLTAQQIALVERWINEGAKWDEHWAFKPIVKPALPPHAAIDHFISRQLEQRGLTFSKEADRATLIRRVSFDLTGLPPSPEQIADFENNRSPTAYEEMVESQLASPAFGERMAWNWLDAARYADTNGYQGDNERTMWPWRDWVIQAYNDNMPFDQFSTWQIAGDLLPGATDQQILATGFLRNHPINGEGGRIAAENRVDYVMDMAETTGTVWLGLTFNCCRCHDHKYDPLTQEDYYSLFAFFNQTPVDGSGGNAQTPPVLAVPRAEQRLRQSVLEVELAELKTTQRKYVDSVAAAQAEWEQLILQESDLKPELSEAIRKPRAERSAAEASMVQEAFLAQDATWTANKKAIEEAESALAKLKNSYPKVMVMEDLAEARQTFVLNRGSYQQPMQEVHARVPDKFRSQAKDAPKNRLALANWLFASSNPITARVAANRLWAQIFGTGLVKTSEDFGVQGEPPSHPELLDWLAAEYRDSGWDTKHMLRLILSSRTYRQSAKVDARMLEIDPDNRLLGRSPRYRLPSWMIRDSILATSGVLVDRLGGSPVNSYQPAGVWEEASFGKKVYQQGKGEDLYRRSIYTFWRRIAAPTMFFDNSDRMTCSVKGFRTNTPLHALGTLNDVAFVEASRMLATEALGQQGTPHESLQWIAGRVLGRPLGVDEEELLLAGLERTHTQFQSDPAAAASFASLGESPIHGDTPLVEIASWTSLVLALQNLDEALTRP